MCCLTLPGTSVIYSGSLAEPADFCMQLIVVSPMVRTLETATGAFGSGPSQTPQDMFMQPLPGQQNWSTEHTAVALPHGIPVISHEGCRERVSKCILFTLCRQLHVMLEQHEWPCTAGFAVMYAARPYSLSLQVSLPMQHVAIFPCFVCGSC